MGAQIEDPAIVLCGRSSLLLPPRRTPSGFADSAPSRIACATMQGPPRSGRDPRPCRSLARRRVADRIGLALRSRLRRHDRRRVRFCLLTFPDGCAFSGASMPLRRVLLVTAVGGWSACHPSAMPTTRPETVAAAPQVGPNPKGREGKPDCRLHALIRLSTTYADPFKCCSQVGYDAGHPASSFGG
jgi:hypothetical protein